MQKVKKIFIMVFFSAVIGFILGFLTYRNYAEKIKMVFSNTNTSYAFQVGVYNSKDMADEKAQNSKGVVIPDQDFYRVYIALATNDELKDLLAEYFTKQGIDYYIRDLDLDKDLKTKMEGYEAILASTSEDKYESIIMKMMQEYQKEGNI